MKSNPVSYCINERKSCVGWIHNYFNDCLCNLNDEISFAFGIISLICWCVADIPQLITNFRSKSSHGVSLLFLLTWILGDAFNLLGCLLEPATLPTQYYAAWLYTTSTAVLVLQTFYYDHVYKWWKCKKTDSTNVIEEAKRPLKPQKPTATQPKRIPSSARYGAFLATSASMPGGTNASVVAFMGYSGRKLLQEHRKGDNAYGQILGWIMTAIYIGGRIPQIWLNIKRGSVEGLNPLMFIFDFIANVTYVGSILVRSTKWEKIRANLPWLLEAVVCAVLDLFIILQYIYYIYMVKNDVDGSKAGKHVVS